MQSGALHNHSHIFLHRQSSHPPWRSTPARSLGTKSLAKNCHVKHSLRTSSLKNPRQPAAAAADAATVADAAAVAPGRSAVESSRPPKSKSWELDFSSRPIFDERGKKKWELLICSPDRSWEYSQFFPNNKINSTQLKSAIAEIIARPGAVKPDRVRFFRGQMQTIITRALTELEIKAIPSRRCFSLLGWLEERLQSIYSVDSTYKAVTGGAFGIEANAPEDLPDALRGEQWSFVQLPMGVLLEELQEVQKRAIFGDTFELASIGMGDMSEETLIPGVAVYSRRAGPMAAWTSGFELANLEPDVERACLILDTGVNRRWRYGAYRRSAETNGEAESWRDAKLAARGLHFLVVQKDQDTEDIAGLWLLLDRALPSI